MAKKEKCSSHHKWNIEVLVDRAPCKCATGVGMVLSLSWPVFERCQAQIMFGVKFTSCLTLALIHIYYKHHLYHYHLPT